MFSLENKFYDKKESALTKYYLIRSKLAVFLKLRTFSFNIQFHDSLINWFPNI